MSARGGFAAILGGCRPLFPPGLLDAAGWERLLECAQPLPRSVIDLNFGFEFHLGGPEASADLFVIVAPETDLPQYYIREGERAGPGSPAAAFAAGLREQAEKSESFLARSVSATILEYDVVGLPPCRRRPPPGIFLVPSEPAPAGAKHGRNAHRDPAGLLAALARIVGWKCEQALLPRLESVFAALPETGYVFQAGALPGRSPQAFRICLKGFGKDELPRLLERLEWPGRLDAAADALARVDDLVAWTAVSIDVTARGVGPRLGLELYRSSLWSAVDRAGWRPFIARLEENGWCLPAKAEGLRDLPGTERLIGGGEIYFVRKGINHVKVTVEEGAPVAAKAYIGMDARPYASALSPSSGRSAP